jgi:hypothetical protein
MSTRNFVRFGILALPLSGVLTLVGLLSRYSTPNPRVDAEAAAQAASSIGFFVGQFVGSILGLILLIFGLLALTAYLANTRARGCYELAQEWLTNADNGDRRRTELTE